MAIKGVVLADQSTKVQTSNIIQDQTANKINNWMIFGYIFLAIGIIATLVATGSLTNILTFIPSSASETILGVAASSIFIGGSCVLKSLYDKKYKAIDCNPKDVGITGIKNSNNNCWLNSLLQILLNNETLREGLKNNKIFKRFIDQYEAAVKGSQNPDSQPLRVFLSYLCPSINRNNEFQDSHEPLVAILDLLRSKNPNLQNTLITKNHYRYQNGKEEVSDKREENNGIINLPISSKVRSLTIPNLIAEYFHSKQKTQANITQEVESTVQEDCFFGLWKRNKIIKETVVVERRDMVLEQRKLAFAPKDLFFCVQRYLSNPNVNVPLNLNLEKGYFENNQGANYRLDGFACNLNRCHYISYIYRNGIWFLCNDNQVEPISEAAAKKAATKAYILHYTKL